LDAQNADVKDSQDSIDSLLIKKIKILDTQIDIGYANNYTQNDFMANVNEQLNDAVNTGNPEQQLAFLQMKGNEFTNGSFVTTNALSNSISDFYQTYADKTGTDEIDVTNTIGKIFRNTYNDTSNVFGPTTCILGEIELHEFNISVKYYLCGQDDNSNKYLVVTPSIYQNQIKIKMVFSDQNGNTYETYKTVQFDFDNGETDIIMKNFISANLKDYYLNSLFYNDRKLD
jgi:hypothetical protein